MSRRETRRVGLSHCLILLMVAMTSNVAVADDGATTYQTLPVNDPRLPGAFVCDQGQYDLPDAARIEHQGF